MTPVEDFKAFLASRPAVEEIQFSIDDKLYFGAWQSNAFLLREVKSWEASHDPARRQFEKAGLPFCGQVGGTAFEIRDGLVLQCEPKRYDLPVYRGIALLELHLNSVLNFGLFDAASSSFVWSGDSFEAHFGEGLKVFQFKVENGQSYDRSKLRIKGRILVQNGFPSKVFVEPYDFRIEYEYDEQNYLGFGIPNVIRVYTESKLTNIYRIHKIAVHAGSDLPESHFRPERFVPDDQIVRARVTGEKSLIFDDTSRGRKYTDDLKRSLLSRTPKGRRPRPWLFYGIFGVTIFLPVLYGIGRLLTRPKT